MINCMGYTEAEYAFAKQETDKKLANMGFSFN